MEDIKMKNVTFTLLATLLTACGSTEDARQVAGGSEKTTLGTFSITSSDKATTSTPTVEWTRPGSASLLALGDEYTYELTVANDSNCKDAVEVKEVKETKATLETLTNGSYYICLKVTSGSTEETAKNSPLAFVVDAEETSAAEETSKVEATKEEVVATEDLNKLGSFAIASVDTLTKRSPTLSWSTSKNATSYEVKICSDSDCNTMEQNYTLTGTSITLLATVDNHLKDGLHYAKVTAKNAGGELAADTYSWTIDVPSLASFGYDMTVSTRNYGSDLSISPLDQWSTQMIYGIAYTYHDGVGGALDNAQCYGFEDGIACLRIDGSYRVYRLVSGTRYGFTY